MTFENKSHSIKRPFNISFYSPTGILSGGSPSPGGCFPFPPAFPHPGPMAPGMQPTAAAAAASGLHRNPGQPMPIPSPTGQGQQLRPIPPNFHHHGSLPNVSAVAAGAGGHSPHSIDLQSALSNLDDLKDGRSVKEGGR